MRGLVICDQLGRHFMLSAGQRNIGNNLDGTMEILPHILKIINIPVNTGKRNDILMATLL